MNSGRVRPSEGDLVEAIVRGVDSIWAGADICREVRSHGRARTDVVIRQSGEVTAIEAKLHHWQRALGQAALNRYYADRSYIAMWASRISRAMLVEAEVHGLGVLAVHEGRLEVLIEAPLTDPIPALRARVVVSLEATEP